MNDIVWISSLFTNSSIGNKLGLRAKFHGEDWQPASHKLNPVNERVLVALTRHANGFHLKREEFPDAMAVFDPGCFTRAGDVFAGGPFYAVKGRTAEILADMDLGEGSLIPMPIFEADLSTPLQGTFYWLDFGCRKRTLLPEQSRNTPKFAVVKATGQQLWHVNMSLTDDDVALSPSALEGPDLWVEELLHGPLFMSDRLAQRLRGERLDKPFRLNRCRIIEGTPA